MSDQAFGRHNSLHTIHLTTLARLYLRAIVVSCTFGIFIARVVFRLFQPYPDQKHGFTCGLTCFLASITMATIREAAIKHRRIFGPCKDHRISPWLVEASLSDLGCGICVARVDKLTNLRTGGGPFYGPFCGHCVSSSSMKIFNNWSLDVNCLPAELCPLGFEVSSSAALQLTFNREDRRADDNDNVIEYEGHRYPIILLLTRQLTLWGTTPELSFGH